MGDTQSAPATKSGALADHGYFFVGGRYVNIGERQLMAGQMYVQYLVPLEVRQPHPIVLIHGTAQTGNNFLGTPDGRPGWAHNFAALGYRVYVVDQVGRGRSGSFPDIYGPYARSAAKDLELLNTAQELHALFPQAHLHTQWPGGPGRPGNAAFDQMFAQQVEFIASAARTEELMFPALEALLEKIGPAILLTHSQAGVFGWKIADACPDLVKAHIAVEPNGPPFYDVSFHGGETWYKYGEQRVRPWGITRVPLSFDPPIRDAAEFAVRQQETADGPGLIKGWLQAEPARQLPRMQRVPSAIITGEASFRATMDHCTSKFLAQAGVAHTHIRLENENVRGNGHMMMLEQNSAEIPPVIDQWIQRSVLHR